MIRYLNAHILFPILEKKAGRLIQPKLRELKQFENLPLAEQEQVRRKQLYQILKHSREHVPYYRDLFKKISFNEENVLRDINFILDLPLITKEVIRSQAERIRLPGAKHIRKTGGSTGQSVFFYYDDVGLDWTAAVNLRAYEMAGNFPSKRDCHISSELDFAPPPMKGKVIDWIKLFSQNRKRLMVRSFSDADIGNTFRNLKSIRPYLLQGHPSSAYAIAGYIKKNQLSQEKYCSVFEPSGEMLTEKVVQVIEQYLGCKVVNRYGNAEFGVMAHSRFTDSYRKLQVFNRAFLVEDTVNSNLIVTGLTNYSFPLFRYDTGDVATVKTEADGTFIYDLQGRIHDLVRIADEDYATHFIMDYLDHKIRHVREFQIILKDESFPLLQIVAEVEEEKERIYREVKNRWPIGLDIAFINYEELKKVGWQQKFRHLIDLRSKGV